MKRYFLGSLLLCACLTSSGDQAGDLSARQVLISGAGLGKIALMDGNSREKWSWPIADEISDAVVLENGNILHSDKMGFIREIKPDYSTGKGGDIVWEWKAAPINGKTGEIHSAQPLPGGRILIGESHDGISFIREIDRKTGEVLKTVELKNIGGKHSTFRQIRKTPQGTYLVTQPTSQGKAMEVDSEGKIIRTFPDGKYTAIRLPNGNTLIACGDAHRLIEVNPDNDIIWEIGKNDIPNVTLGFVAGVQRLPNGNTVITNWGGHGGASGPAILEVTPDKKVAWQSSPGIPNRVSSVQVLDKSPSYQQPLR